MSLQTSQHLRDYIRRICADAAAPSDAMLWGRFVQSNDQDAFEVLLHRHGSMVLACACRVLSDRSEAEDVFQATFLTLARSKGRIHDPNALTSWLYRTAIRFAGKLRAKQHAMQAMPEEAVTPDRTETDVAWREARGILDEELDRLPEKLRAPLLLCYLSGLTRDEAARQIGCSFDQLKRRLEEGRNTLRRRLESRGIAGAGLALAVLSPELLQAAVPPPLVASCLALVFVSEATVPATVASLTLTTAMTKGFVMKTIIASVLCVSLGVWGYTATVNSREPQDKAPPPGGQPPDPTPVAKADPPAAPDPADTRRAGSEQRRRSLGNLRKILIGVHHHMDACQYLPADLRDNAGKPLLSWRVAILPYLGDDTAALYKQFKLNEPWDSEHNFKLLARMPDVYRSGIEAKDSSHTYYQVFAGPRTPLHPVPEQPDAAGPKPFAGGGPGGPPPGGISAPPGGPRGPMGSGLPPGFASGGGRAPGGPAAYPRIGFAHVTDGLSNTLGVVEAGPSVAWTKPADIPFDPDKPLPRLTGPFANALHVSMMDGSTSAIKRGIEDAVMRHLITMDDGMVNPDFNKLHAALPPETAEERRELKKKEDENRKLIDQLSVLQKENARLLDLLNRAAADFDEAEEMKSNLKQLLEGLQSENENLKAEVNARSPKPVPGVKTPAKK